MFLFAGLGNPGTEHAGNRHNIGFMAIDALHRVYDFSSEASKYDGAYASAHVDGVKIFTFKPMTYMNRSGIPLSAFARFYKISLDNIFVFYDELDLPLGKLRVKKGGGAGGHNGIKSIDQHVGLDYWRVRLGISHPGEKSRVTSHVLSDFSATEQDIVHPWLQTIAKTAPLLLKHDSAGFMNKMALP